VSYVDELLDAYRRFVSLPWPQQLAGPQRVWMALYPPEHERRLRLQLPSFKEATNEYGHPWALIDITISFECWMADNSYRDAYFEEPELLSTALPGFFAHLVEDMCSQLGAHSTSNCVVALLGVGTLFGLGDSVKVSALLNAVNDAVAGRLLVFFPGEHQGSSYRLLDARDGWNYLAIPITPNGDSR